MSDSGSCNSAVKWISEILDPHEEPSSGSEPPASEWSSLITEPPKDNKKCLLKAEGLYSPGSGEVCTKYIGLSDSDIARHVYYNYPAVPDPGIVKALLHPEKTIIYEDDGQDMYLALCDEMELSPVRMFHRNLVTEAINLSYYGVNPRGIRAMTMSLQRNRTVLRFDLTDNFLNDDAVYHLGQMLTFNTTIKELILSGCRIGASGILRLGSTLRVNRSLVTLNLSKNCLGEDGGVNFAKKLEEGAGVSRVSLSRNDLGKATAYALAEALECQNKLTHLDLSWNNFFHSPSTVKMLEQLSYSDVLQELNLAWNAMEGDRVAIALKYVLLVPTLKVLNLSHNRLQGQAVMTIVKKLLSAKKLETLDLSFNPMSTEDAYDTLAMMLRPRVKLQNLLLDGITVEKKFLMLLDNVMMMKTRRNFSIKYGLVLHNWTVQGPDPRKVIMDRMDYLGMRANKKHRVDIALFFLKIGKQFTKPIPVKTLLDVKAAERVPLDEDFIIELGNIFSSSKAGKNKLVDVQMICEYINRMWPDKKLPPTPPPEPESVPEPPLPPTPPASN